MNVSKSLISTSLPGQNGQENAEDILAEAKQVNEDRFAMEKNSVETAEEASLAVQKMQEEIYGGSMFSTAEEFKNNKFLNQIDRKMKEL